MSKSHRHSEIIEYIFIIEHSRYSTQNGEDQYSQAYSYRHENLSCDEHVHASVMWTSISTDYWNGMIILRSKWTYIPDEAPRVGEYYTFAIYMTAIDYNFEVRCDRTWLNCLSTKLRGAVIGKVGPIPCKCMCNKELIKKGLDNCKPFLNS